MAPPSPASPRSGSAMSEHNSRGSKGTDTNLDSHLSPRASLLGSTRSVIEMSSEGRADEWSVRAEAASRASSLTHHTSSSLAVHTSQMGMPASRLGSRRLPIGSQLSSFIPDYPPPSQDNAATQKGVEDPRPVVRSAEKSRRPRLPPIPPVPALPANPPRTSLLSRTSSVAHSRYTALPSYREAASPSPDMRFSHEYPPLALLPGYTEPSAQAVPRSVQAPDSRPDEITPESPHDPSPPQPVAVRASVQTESTRVSFQQHPFAVNAPVLFRTSSCPSHLSAFPITSEPTTSSLRDSTSYNSQEPEFHQRRWTSRTYFMFGFSEWTPKTFL